MGAHRPRTGPRRGARQGARDGGGRRREGWRTWQSRIGESSSRWPPTAPLHAIRAFTPGSGKSFLVDLAAVIATGRRCPVIAAGKTEEETEKRLGALLRDAVPVVSIDNVNGELGGDMLCQLMERPLVRVRIWASYLALNPAA